MGKRLSKVVLSNEELLKVEEIIKKGTHSSRKIKRAQALLQLHKGIYAEVIAPAIGLSVATVYNIHNNYLALGLAALEEKPRSGQPRKVTPELEAAVTRIACSEAPEGYARWSVSLINGQIVKLGYQVHDESVRLILKKASSSPGSKSSGASVK